MITYLGGLRTNQHGNLGIGFKINLDIEDAEMFPMPDEMTPPSD